MDCHQTLFDYPYFGKDLSSLTLVSAHGPLGSLGAGQHFLNLLFNENLSYLYLVTETYK